MNREYTQLILTGGIFHDFEASAQALAAVLAPLGITSRIEPDMEAGLASLADSPVDLVTVNALRWEMIGEKYDPYRETEAYSPSPTARAALSTYLAQGGALLGLHTASICFSDWPEWTALLGGHWVWGTSWHPQPEAVTVAPSPENPLLSPQSFNVFDELYTDLSLSPNTEVLASATSAAMPQPQPVMWRHQHTGGRVVYDALGHDHESLLQPDHANALREMVRWALTSEETL